MTTSTAASVATFNCEWRKTASSDAALIREQLRESEADVVCLTETQRDFLSDSGHTILSEQLDTGPDTDSRRKVLLWSRNPWTFVDSTGPQDLPEGRYVSGKTQTAAGEVQFVGVCIPYRFASVRYGAPKRRPWEVHLEYLCALDRFLPSRPELTVVLGDFNQRFPRKYQPQRVFDALDDTLLKRFTLATAGLVAPIQRQAIDHICHSPDLHSVSSKSLSNIRPDGGQISDHFGVRVELIRERKAL